MHQLVHQSPAAKPISFGAESNFWFGCYRNPAFYRMRIEQCGLEEAVPTQADAAGRGHPPRHYLQAD